MQPIDALELFREWSWKRYSPHPIELPEEFHAPECKSIWLLRNRNLVADMLKPFVVASEIGWKL
jgi:hypothetical protein